MNLHKVNPNNVNYNILLRRRVVEIPRKKLPLEAIQKPCGPILAFTQTIHMSASFISPLVAGAITQDNYGLEQWRKIFGISSAVSILTYVAFQIFGTAEIQKWNYSERNIPDKEAASKKLLSVTPSKENDGDVVISSEDQP